MQIIPNQTLTPLDTDEKIPGDFVHFPNDIDGSMISLLETRFHCVWIVLAWSLFSGFRHLSNQVQYPGRGKFQRVTDENVV